MGISSIANTVAVIELAKRPENNGKLVVTVSSECGRAILLSSALFEGLRKEAEAMQRAPVG